jgi:hypothetical protein
MTVPVTSAPMVRLLTGERDVVCACRVKAPGGKVRTSYEFLKVIELLFRCACCTECDAIRGIHLKFSAATTTHCYPVGSIYTLLN